jgi:hypothetical protein
MLLRKPRTVIAPRGNLAMKRGRSLAACVCTACLLVVLTVDQSPLGAAAPLSFVGPGQQAAGAPAQQVPAPAEPELPDPADEALKAIEPLIAPVATPDRSYLAKALNAEETSSGKAASSSTTLTNLGDLGGDGFPVMALRWTRFGEDVGAPAQPASEADFYALLLLAWDGTRWRASKLLSGGVPYSIQVLPHLSGQASGLAVIVFEARRRVPYPIVFRLQDHNAVLAWDSQADDSRYEGYAGGKVQFRKAGSGPPEMVASGKADPGVISFPPNSSRGFEATEIYRWEKDAFVPIRAEYTHNADYVLYQFIAALHLHDFHSAYALVDPAQFLKTKEATLDLFRQTMETSWSEFLDDQVFEARATSPDAVHAYAFELKTDDKHYLYLPSFSKDERHRLTGLERQEVK